jgi:hypothetical protein
VLRVADLLAAAPAGGALDLGAALEAHARRCPGPAAALVVSDFMQDPAAIEPGVQALRTRGYHVTLLHVVGASELDPRREFARGVLCDAESGATHAIDLDGATMTRYAALLAEHFAALAALADRAGARYARLAPDASVATFVIEDLARIGLVRRR